jgi:choline dehydrogenase-like flavoprotein
MGDTAARAWDRRWELNMPDYDVVIVGAGPVGAVLAKYLGESGHSVLVLEAGPAVGRTWAEYQANVAQYRAAGFKVPNSPYYSPPDAPSPSVLDIRPLTPGSLPADNGYFVQDGPFPFGTDYLRSQGGTMLHWLGTCLRQTPADFEMRSRYGHGRDWPVSYVELSPYYEAAELEFGVAANVEDQKYCGITFRSDYVFPMYRIPPSYLDQQVAAKIDGQSVTIDGARYKLLVSSTPQARNSIPNPAYNGGAGYTPVGAPGAPHEGLRCQGNSSCIPICPVQAKYSPLKTWAQVSDLPKVTLRTQCVVSRVVHSGRGEITALEFIPYTDGVPPPAKPERVTAKLYVLAGNPIENAKLLLASEVPNSNDLIGRNLMDHPYLLAWALMPESVGAFRGPSSTSGIEVLRDGPFRSHRAAFRMELVNWGWDFAAFAPYSDVQNAVFKDGRFGGALRTQLATTVPRQFHLGFLYEQLPNPRNRVYVDRAYCDPLGIPRPRIEYHLDDYTRAGMAASRELWTQLFTMLGTRDSTDYWETDPFYLTYEGKPYAFRGAGHIVGTHRMGDAADQRCWEHPNLYLVGCGSLPTVATSNPSLTMMALALRTLERLEADLGTAPGSRV